MDKMNLPIVQAVIEQEKRDGLSNVVGIQLPNPGDKPIFRLVYRQKIDISKNERLHIPLINYVHASDVNEANDFGQDMSTKISGYVFCPHETELIEVMEIT